MRDVWLLLQPSLLMSLFWQVSLIFFLFHSAKFRPLIVGILHISKTPKTTEWSKTQAKTTVHMSFKVLKLNVFTSSLPANVIKCFINYFTLFLYHSLLEAALLCLQCGSSTTRLRGETDAGSFPACRPCWGIWSQPHLCGSDGRAGTIQDWASHPGIHSATVYMHVRSLFYFSIIQTVSDTVCVCGLHSDTFLFWEIHWVLPRKFNCLTSPVVHQEMWDQEKRHLQKFNEILAESRVRPTALLPFWNIAGFALGLDKLLSFCKLWKTSDVGCNALSLPQVPPLPCWVRNGPWPALWPWRRVFQNITTVR